MKLYAPIRIVIILFVLLSTTTNSLWSYLAGELDPSFDGDGIVTTSIGISDIAYALTLDAGGKILAAGRALIAGRSRFAVARYDTNGSLDLGFGYLGTATQTIENSAEAYAIVIDLLGGIVTGGQSIAAGPASYKFALARFNADGSVDNGFGYLGTMTTAIGGEHDTIYGIALDADENIVVAGYATINSHQNIALARYTSAGALDADFGYQGTVTTLIDIDASARAVVIDADGKILVAGESVYDENGSLSHFALARYNSNGSLDTAFGYQGTMTTEIDTKARAEALALDAAGNIVVAGYAIYDVQQTLANFALARYTSDGFLDTAFGYQGTVTLAIGSDAQAKGVVLDADGRIIVAGYATLDNVKHFALARYTSDGILDTDFGYQGTVTTAIGSNAWGDGVILDEDGKIVVAGYAEDNTVKFALARYFGENCTPVITGSVINAATAAVLPNITVQLYDELFNTFYATTITNNCGVYTFTSDIEPSTSYGIRVLAPIGSVPLMQDVVITATCGTTYAASVSFTSIISQDPLTRAIQEKYFGLTGPLEEDPLTHAIQEKYFSVVN